MNIDRPPTGAIMERPRTRWSRDQIDTPSTIYERQTSANRSVSKMERPQSRRGLKPELQIDNQGTLPRPVSTALFMNNRGSAMGSRLGTMSSSTARLNTAYPTTSQRVLDRPITQQGIPGMRPGSTRGVPRLSRLVQDKRYYEGLLQLKIRELTQEIESIAKGIEQQNKEKAALMHYDRRAKDLAAELADLQGQLADYNTVLDKMTSNVEKSVIERAANELASINEGTIADIEKIFEQRQKAEQKLHSLQNDIEKEKKNAERIVATMDPVTKKKYDELFAQRAKLKEEIDKIQEEVDELTKEKNKLEEGIALSQVKQEAVKLNVKIVEMEAKRDRLLEESKNKLSPENEKSQLLEKVRQDNVDIAASENRIAVIKKRTLDVEQELERLEKDIEEHYKEKGATYKEFHKREQVMEQFLSTFDTNKSEELEKLRKLEKVVVERLEEMSSKLSGGVYFNANIDSILDIQFDDGDNVENPLNIDELKKRYRKLQHNFLKMKAFETKFKTEIAELDEKIKKKEGDLQSLEELEKLKMSNQMSFDDLCAERDQCKKELESSEQELENTEKEYNEMKEKLMKNEIYRTINVLEQTLETIKQKKETTENFINKQRDRLNYSPLRSQAYNLIKKYNNMLTNANSK